MLTQPILYNIAAFDASEQQTFTFFVSGGDQVVANTLTIRTNDEAQTIVYSEKQVTYGLAHTLPANTLTNGIYYQATITTWNVNNESSVASLPIQFYCYTQPSFAFTNLPTGNIIGSSAYNFQVLYNQNEEEPLSAYTFNLYDFANNLIASSGVVYTQSQVVPLTISYTFDGFTNGSIYIVETVGQTFGGTQITTGKVTINVQYEIPQNYAPLYIKNNCEEGYITVQSNLIVINGETNPASPTYIDNQEIDLRAEGTYARWGENYTVTDDYTITLFGRAFNPDSVIGEFSNNKQNRIVLKYMQNDSGAWFELFVYPETYNSSGNIHALYTCQSNVISGNISDTDRIGVAVRCIDNVYMVRCQKY